MLRQDRIARALEERRGAFEASLRKTSLSVETYRQALGHLSRLGSAGISDRFGGVLWPGARPTSELDREGPVLRFENQWSSHEEMRAWALRTLRGVTTVGIDGSQIAASKEFGVPVSLVQVAWFKNPHNPDQQYVKDVRDEILGPDESAGDYADGFFADSIVHQRRFALEIDVAIESMRTLESDGSQTPVVFFDGTLVVSFAGRMSPAVREAYIAQVIKLLDESQRLGVPVIGYVDLSFASDLATMMRTALELPGAAVFDAQILTEDLRPLDRTAVFQCARGDVLPWYRTRDRDWSSELYFLYLKTGAEQLPVRLDVPRWVVDQGLLERVVDVVRAEVVVGTGYPYALETADAAAVLTVEDRLTFYRMFHEFAAASELHSSVPGKSASKIHRRV